MQAKDGGWGWMVVCLSFMVNLLVDGVCYTFGILFPEFIRYFGESKGKTQLLNSVMLGSYFVLGPIVSVLVNKYGCRNVAQLGAITSSVGIFLSSFSPNLDVMIISYSFVGGIGLGLLYFPSIMIINMHFDKRLALATGIAICGSGVGGFVFAPTIEILLETYGWRGTMWIVSAVSLNGVVVSAMYQPQGTKKVKENKSEIMKINVNHGKFGNKNAKTTKAYLRKLCLSTEAVFHFALLKSPTMLMYGASCFFTMFGFFVPINFLPTWASVVNLSLIEGTILIQIIGASTTVTRVVIGFITDKPWANSLIIYNTVMLTGGVATCFVPYFTTFAALAIYAFVYGIVMAAFVCLRSVLMTELLGSDRHTSSFGLVGLSMGLSTFVGSPIAGALSDISGNYNLTFYFGGITLVLGAVLCLPLRRVSAWESRRPNNHDKCAANHISEKEERCLTLVEITTWPSTSEELLLHNGDFSREDWYLNGSTAEATVLAYLQHIDLNS
ncbi:monocarboxylate transporter 13-like [Ylistrum balloti]|uniref:monocarboxylate transporter 13-like n=1 Tax=Ylistrum balloti TaxID=509963 RepID=UPI002905E884|nr:monocarboxylate transporter 13-like [Ylistrum balloti]